MTATARKLDDLLDERGKTHGDFREQFSMSRSLKSVFVTMTAQQSMTPVQLEVLDMIAVKISRIATGDNMEPDHWLDISGYAKKAHEEAVEFQRLRALNRDYVTASDQPAFDAGTPLMEDADQMKLAI